MKFDFLTDLFKKSTTNDIDTLSVSANATKHPEEKQSKVLIENGKSKVKDKKYQDAIDDFTKAIEFDPNSIDAFFERSKAKRELKDSGGADKDLDQGKRLLDNLDNGLKANDEGNAYYESYDYKNAIKSYNKAIPLIPTITTIYYYRGCSKQFLDDFDGAMEDFTKSIDANASNSDLAYCQRSKIKSYKLKDKVGALQDLNKAIEINPNDADFYYSRATLQDDYDGIKDLDKSIELDANNPDAYVARCLKKKGMEDYEGSIADLTKYIQLNPKESLLTISEAYSLRAGMKLLSNDLEGSLKDHNNAIEAAPTNSDAYMERGIVKDLLRDYEEAITDFTKAIELNPKNAEAFYQRGAVRQKIGIMDEGMMDVIKAKSIGYIE